MDIYKLIAKSNSMKESKQKSSKIFSHLSLAVSVVLSLLFLALFIIPFFDISKVYPVWFVLGAIVIFAILAMLYGASSVLVYAYYGKNILRSKRKLSFIMRTFLPFAEFLGRNLSFSIDEIRRSFIKLNNELVLDKLTKVDADNALILLPHCLQASSCKLRLVHEVENCVRCGKCVQGDLLNLRDKYNVKLVIATGGTIARRILAETRPKFIVAVACERDLASGIYDAYPLTVYGILNDRPAGPCVDTTVAINKIERILNKVLV